MKKTLLAVAVAAALPAAAFAQTNVTLYGIADVGAGWNDTDGPGDSSTMVVNSGYQSTSRFGVRGTEDLGSGLKATFNIEAGVKWDTGNSDPAGFWQRRSVVGLAGGFGEVRLGRDYTPAFSAAGTTDVMGYGLLGNWLTYTAGAGGITTRGSNGIHYTGTFSGVTLRAMYAEGELTDQTVGGVKVQDSGGNDAFGLSAVYAGGPLTIQGYYQEVNNVLGDAVKQAGIGAGYNFGAFRLTLTYGVADADGTALVRAAAAGSPDVDKMQALGLGAGIKVGTGEVLAQVIQIKGDSATAGLRDPKGTSFGLAYVHPLSKRTNLYATYGMMRNNSTGNFAILASDNSVAAGAAGADPKGVAIGIRHLF
ncbi:MAG: porin [Burkholderiaceae bacterium]|nr:porin [Burkholderiaceae bacterium]